MLYVPVGIHRIFTSDDNTYRYRYLLPTARSNATLIVFILDSRCLGEKNTHKKPVHDSYKNIRNREFASLEPLDRTFETSLQMSRSAEILRNVHAD